MATRKVDTALLERVSEDTGAEALEDRRAREALAATYEKNIRDAAVAEAALYGVDADVWLALAPEKRRELMAKGKPQGERPEKPPVTPEIDMTGTSSIDGRFVNLARGMITREERKDWVVLCDPVRHDRRWGTYTPGLSRVPRANMERKTNPAIYNPPFTIEPVAPFPPEPTVLCDLHQADGRACDFATYEEEGGIEDNTLLLYHQQKVHAEELKARELRNKNAESRADREERKALLSVIATLQSEVATLRGQVAAKE